MAAVQRLTDLQLVPVLELLPWQFSDRESPTVPEHERAAAWSRHWFDCLEEAGVIGLNPVAPNSCHIPVTALTDLTTLDHILNKLVEPDTRSDPESATALSGGVALVSGGAVLVEPQCCVDLGDWREWHSIAAHTAPKWKSLWIGHPCLAARAEGSDLVLAGPHESAPPEPHWVFDRELVAPAVERAVRELERFADRLTVVLLGPDAKRGAEVRALAQRLAGVTVIAANA